MKIQFLTIFPNIYDSFLQTSIIKKIIDKKMVEFHVVNLRDFADDSKRQTVDDKVYGGGRGMILKVEPIAKALNKIKGYKIMLSPQGQVFTQQIAKKLAKKKILTFISGRYEGFDERVRTLVDEEISIGDYILFGGEVASMVLTEAIVRCLPEVIKSESLKNESFETNLLDYPQYTKPRNYKNMAVPDVLLSGNHEQIKKWRKKMQIKKTKIKREDLMKKGDSNEN